MNGAETQLPLSKRLLAALFALVLVVGMAPVSAWAEGEGNAQDGANTEQTDNENSSDVTGGGESSDNAGQDSTEPGDAADANDDIEPYSLSNINSVNDSTCVFNYDENIDKKDLYTALKAAFEVQGDVSFTIKFGDSSRSISKSSSGTFKPVKYGECSYEVKWSVKESGKIVKKSGTLILKENVYVDSLGSSVAYNGEEQKLEPSVTTKRGSLKKNDDYRVSYGTNKNYTDAGSTITVTVDFIGDYANYGKAEQTYSIVKANAKVSVKGKSETMTYNGQEQSFAGFEIVGSQSYYDAEKNVALAEGVQAKGADADTYSMNLTAESFVNNDDNFNVEFTVVEDGSLTIAPAEATVSIKGKSDEVTYNGKEQSIEGFEVADVKSDASNYFKKDSVVLAEKAEAKASGTNASSEPYKMNLTGDSFTCTDKNFNVVKYEVTDGGLTIDPAEVAVSVEGNTKTATYSGQEQSVEGFEVIGVEGYAMDCFDFNSVLLADSCSAKATGTDADTYKMGLTEDSFYCADENFNVVKYEVTDGELVIDKRAIEVSDSATYAYNGQEQALSIDAAKVTNLVDGDRLYLNGAQVKGTEPGTYTDVTEYTWDVVNDKANVTANYNLKVSGELTITKADSGSGSAADNGNTGKGDKTDKAKASSASPQTGDSIAPFAMAAGIIAIAAALAAFFVSRKLRGTTRR